MNRTRRSYDKEFKEMAVDLINTGRSIRDVADELGIQEGLLRRWKCEKDSFGTGSFLGKGNLNLSPEFKTKVSLEAIKELHTTAELAKKYELHPTQISTWKKEFLEGASSVFDKGGKKKKSQKQQEDKSEELYAKIGKLQVELDFLQGYFFLTKE